MSADHGDVRIAIVGGGVAGVSLFHSLLEHQHLDVHIFESARVFKETGAAFGLQRNVMQALALLSPTALTCLDRAGMVPQEGHQIMLAEGPDTGKTVVQTLPESVDDTPNNEHGGIVHRAAFLHEFLVNAPTSRMHASKKVAEIQQTDNVDEPVTLSFEDGTTHQCDIVIGADGIHSFVRKYILGINDPAATPVAAGWWAVQEIIPFTEAQSILGNELVDEKKPIEYDWIGDGTWILHNALSDGTLVQLIAASCCDRDEASGSWFRSVTAEELRGKFKSWPTHLSQAVEVLLCNKPTKVGLYQYEHLPAKTYVKGSVAIMGDAAHATTSWQASGAGMSIEDSVFLSTLLGLAKTPQDARAALRVYDTVRRPHTQRIVESSRATGMLMTGQDADVGLDQSKLKKELATKWDMIREYDVPKHRDDAVYLMEQELHKE